jgi:hypothetical protein
MQPVGPADEKGGKRHEMPCHHNLDAYLQAYVEGTRIGGNPKNIPSPTADWRLGILLGRAITQSYVRRGSIESSSLRASSAERTAVFPFFTEHFGPRTGLAGLTAISADDRAIHRMPADPQRSGQGQISKLNHHDGVIVRFIVNYMGRRAASVFSSLVREGDYSSTWNVDLRRDRSAFDRNPLKTWALMANKSILMH